VKVFAALGDETRWALVTKLSGGTTMSITRLTEGQTVTRQSITKHLRILKQAGLVRNVRRGRESCFALETTSLERARQSLDRISQQWDVALNRLKESLESSG
jgi:DNA-binding transcriptional ArsR family regulator